MQLKKYLLISAVVVLAAAGGVLFYGVLFPYLPFVPGFEKKEYGRAVIYYHAGTDPEKYAAAGKLADDVETFYGMKLRGKVGIIVCATEAESTRLAGHAIRFLTCRNGRIIVGGNAGREIESGAIKTEKFIRHELSHSVLFANQSPFTVIPKWINEGLATYSADLTGSGGYYTFTQVETTIRSGVFWDPRGDEKEEWKNLKKAMPGPSAYFVYSQWAYLLCMMDTRFGREKFKVFIREVISGRSVNAAFEGGFGEKFGNFIERQLEAINEEG